MTIALAGDHLTTSRHGRDDLARLDRQDLVVVPVEEQQRSTSESGRDFASGRLSREGDDTAHFVHRDGDPNRHRTSERMPHDDDSFGPGITRDLNDRRYVETTSVEIVGTSIRDPKYRNSALRPRVTQFLVQTVCGSEQTAHRSATSDDRGRSNGATSRYFVPQHGDETTQREEFEMAERRCDRRALRRQHVEGVKR